MAESRHVTDVIEVRDRLPQLAVRVVQVYPIGIPEFLVSIKDAARVAIAGRFARYPVSINYSHWAHFPFAPRRLGPTQRQVVALGVSGAILVKDRQCQDVAVAEILSIINRRATVKAIGLGVIIGPVEAEHR